MFSFELASSTKGLYPRWTDFTIWGSLLTLFHKESAGQSNSIGLSPCVISEGRAFCQKEKAKAACLFFEM